MTEINSEEYISEHYTFTKDTYVGGELENSVNCEFRNKNNVVDVLQSMVQFLNAAGYTYIEKLDAEKSGGDIVSSDDEVSEEILDILTDVIDAMDARKKSKVRDNVHNLRVVDNDNEDTDNTPNNST
jgi:hypothetical protein